MLNLYEFKNDKSIKQYSHSYDINCVQYFHDHNERVDYIITLSQLDNDILKIWKFDYEHEDKLTPRKNHGKDYLQKEIEIFCILI